MIYTRNTYSEHRLAIFNILIYLRCILEVAKIPTIRASFKKCSQGGKSRQKCQFLSICIALHFNTSHFVVSSNRKIKAFWKKGTFSGTKQAQGWGGGKSEDWRGGCPPTLYVKRGPGPLKVTKGSFISILSENGSYFQL